MSEYCHSSEEISPARFEIDHIQPRSIGGSDNLDNLALACQRCNSHHYNFIQGKDPATLNAVNLFHPRHQVWNDHFIWSNDGTGLLKRDKYLKVFLGKLFTSLLLNHHKSLLDKPCSYSSLL
ncbi:HNH endonuclease [Phormidium tenue]|uniref:HNH endonuclease n=1 Tax=Phormidium tenue TaxID=126344 RepID=UPI001F552F2C